MYSCITVTACVAALLTVDVCEICASGTSKPVRRQLSMRACLGALSNCEIKPAASTIVFHRYMFNDGR